MRNILSIFMLTLCSTIFNFAIFLVAYKYLTFPFLYEEQRAENAPYIFFYVLPSILVLSFLFFLVAYFVFRRKV